jgi:hypothetical protein
MTTPLPPSPFVTDELADVASDLPERVIEPDMDALFDAIVDVELWSAAQELEPLLRGAFADAAAQ